MDPVQITKKLGLKPNHCSRQGEPRVMPNGQPLPGTYRDTRWSLSFSNHENMTIADLVTKAVGTLPVGSDFWSDLSRTGGKAELILAVVGTKYQGTSLDADIVRSLAEMGMRLGLEIYAVPQNG